MLYFPIAWLHAPEWIPWIGGDDFLFFSPIFNIADAAITCGVLSILLFQRRFFREALTHHPEGDIEPHAELDVNPPEQEQNPEQKEQA